MGLGFGMGFWMVLGLVLGLKLGTGLKDSDLKDSDLKDSESRTIRCGKCVGGVPMLDVFPNEVFPNREVAGEVGFACKIDIGSHGFPEDEALDVLHFPSWQAW